MVLGDGGSTSTGGTSTGDTGGSQQSGQSQQQQQQSNTTNTGSQASWVDSLPEDLRGHEGLKKFKSPEDLSRSWISAQSMIGKKGVILPGEKATDEDLQRFYKEVGLPDLDKYEVKGPDGAQVNEEFMKNFREQAHKAGVMPKQAKALLDWYLGAESQTVKSANEAKEKAVQEGLKGLRSEWGQGYDKNIAMGEMALRELGGDEMLQHVVKTGLGKDPAFIKLCAKMGEALGEDKLRGEDSRRFSGESPKELQKKFDMIFESEAYTDSRHPGHKRAVDEAAEIMQKLHG
jgi:hypothetical protein